MIATRSRYVVLHHLGIPEPHFDIMIETTPNSPLATWRSSSWPILIDMPLTRLSDHRSSYLEYEGPVSGDRGFVRRVAEGICTADEHGRVRMDNVVIEQVDESWIAKAL